MNQSTKSANFDKITARLLQEVPNGDPRDFGLRDSIHSFVNYPRKLSISYFTKDSLNHPVGKSWIA